MGAESLNLMDSAAICMDFSRENSRKIRKMVLFETKERDKGYLVCMQMLTRQMCIELRLYDYDFSVSHFNKLIFATFSARRCEVEHSLVKRYVH